MTDSEFGLGKAGCSSQAEVGLSASCSRFSKKFPVISEKVAQTLLKKQSKVAFCKEVARKNKNF